MNDYVDDMVLISETQLRYATRLLADDLGLLIEPAGAAGVAALLVLTPLCGACPVSTTATPEANGTLDSAALTGTRPVFLRDTVAIEEAAVEIEVHHIDTQHLTGPTELATAFGGPVFVPAEWPPPFATAAPRYMLDRDPVSVGYRIDVATDDGVPLLLAGRPNPPSQRAGMLGAPPDSYWFAIPDLASERGLALREPNGHFHLVGGKPMQVHLSGYRSLQHGVAAAQNLIR